MKKLLIAAMAGALLASTAGLTPALAQAPAAAPAAKLSAATTPIETIIKNTKAKAALEKAFPELVEYYDQIGSMTLTDLISISQGLIDEAKIKALQAEFDKI